MRQEDRDFLKEIEKRIDDRHAALLTYLSSEFERASKHMSRQNDRTTKLEIETAFARWVHRRPLASFIIAVICISIIVTALRVIGIIELLRLI